MWEHMLPSMMNSFALASNIITVKLKLIPRQTHHSRVPRKVCPWDAEQAYSAAVADACIPGTAQVMDGA